MSQFYQVLDGQSVSGAIVIVVVAIIALISLSLTLFHVIFVVASPAYARHMSITQERNFILSPLGFYIICLFASNFSSALGGVLEAQWIGAQAVSEGPVCTAQAFALQLGNRAGALWIAVISISALRIFMFRARPFSRRITLAMICVLWIFMIIFDGLAWKIFANGSGDAFYGVAGLWCWISPSYPTIRVASSYAWMWGWSFVGAICFILVFLSVRGNITVRRDRSGRSIRWNKRAFNSYALGSGEEQYGALVGSVGKTMCWFSICYITLTIPISVTRVAETYGFPVPSYAFVFSAVNFSLLGIVNPIVYLAIRHSLKHALVSNGSDTTLHESCGGDKTGTESFYTPQEKRPSPVSRYDSYPWIPTLASNESVPPRRGSDDATSSSALPVGSGDSMSVYRGNGVSPIQIPGPRFPQRQRPRHQAMDSFTTVASSGTVVGPSTKLSPVLERDSISESTIKLQLAIPPAAVIARRQSAPSPTISPADLDRLANVPLSPAVNSQYGHFETETPVYSGPRAISPDVNALLQASQTVATSIGPPPPPRKTRRSPIPSVPIDVDESDQGSICSARPSLETFNPDDTRPLSLGDITARNPVEGIDSARPFWATSSPLTPNMPHPTEAPPTNRDTMRTFWAAYEGTSPIHPDTVVPDSASLRPGMSPESKVTSPASIEFRPINRSIAAKPSLTAFGKAPTRNNSQSSVSIYRKPSVASRVIAEHRRSRSFSNMPTPPVAALIPGAANLRPSNSANARYVDPNVPNVRLPMQSDTNRMPRPQPGYL